MKANKTLALFVRGGKWLRKRKKLQKKQLQKKLQKRKRKNK